MQSHSRCLCPCPMISSPASPHLRAASISDLVSAFGLTPRINTFQMVAQLFLSLCCSTLPDCLELVRWYRRVFGKVKASTLHALPCSRGLLAEHFVLVCVLWSYLLVYLRLSCCSSSSPAESGHFYFFVFGFFHFIF